MLNNCLGEPELNRLGLHALTPGTRLASNMAPTVGRADDGTRVLAVGSPGADRITTALMQVLGRFALQGLELSEAIDRPRLHVSFRGDFADPGASAVPDVGDAVAVAVDEPAADLADEPVAIVHVEDDDVLVRAVEAAGLEAVVHPTRSMYFGGVAAAYRRSDGSLGAAADARRESATGVS
jgi:gamma-glutamyltranspeptidase/glutathione hydrolase